MFSRSGYRYRSNKRAAAQRFNLTIQLLQYDYHYHYQYYYGHTIRNRNILHTITSISRLHVRELLTTLHLHKRHHFTRAMIYEVDRTHIYFIFLSFCRCCCCCCCWCQRQCRSWSLVPFSSFSTFAAVCCFFFFFFFFVFVVVIFLLYVPSDYTCIECLRLSACLFLCPTLVLCSFFGKIF